MKKLLSLFCGLLITVNVSAQNSDSLMLRKIYSEALVNGKAYSWLYELTTNHGKRLSGSEGAEKAVQWAKKVMTETLADSVWLQECYVPHWVRGEKEIGKIIDSKNNPQTVPVCALGMSVGTSKDGMTASIIEVHDFDELKRLGGNMQTAPR